MPKSKTGPKTTRLRCDNCGYTDEDHHFPEAKDIFQRLDVGGVFGSQECPKCGALAFPPRSRKPYYNFAKNTAGEVLFVCYSCQHEGTEVSFPEAKDLLQRFEPGDHFTDKECPQCGCLAYPKRLKKWKARR